MRILIVEDEKDLSSYLYKSFENRGYQVVTCQNLNEFDALLSQNDFNCDFAVFDRMLQDSDFTVEDLRKFKNRFPRVGVIILSALGSSYDKSRFLDVGADDYISKPFSIDELLSRLQAISRRLKSPQAALTIKKINDLELNIDQQTVTVKGKKLDLSRKEFLLLKLFLDVPSRVYSRYQILDRIWDIHTDVESNVVEVTIKNLRKKLESADSNLKIQSRRNVGYWVEV